jgi:hypothetical protein
MRVDTLFLLCVHFTFFVQEKSITEVHGFRSMSLRGGVVGGILCSFELPVAKFSLGTFLE